VPCETQELPNLAAPFASVTAFGGSGGNGLLPPLGQPFDTEALRRAEEILKQFEERRP
jgi:hypothetical protein